MADTSRIQGSTDVYLILGDPVDQVLAPAAFNAVFRRFGIDAVLVPGHVPPAHLHSFVRSIFHARNVRGLSLTIPHKAAVLEVLEHVGPAGRLAGAVNAVRRNEDGTLEGEMFDGAGFVGSLRHFGIATAGARVLLLGAGGAAAAIAAALATRIDGTPAWVALYDPAPGRAQALADRLSPRVRARVSAVAQPDPAEFDLVVNASPLGLRPQDPLPCDPARLASHAAVLDILMKNQPTPLVRAARARGLQAEAGFEMLVQQVHLYLDFFGHAGAARALREDPSLLRPHIHPHPHGEASPSPALTIEEISP